MEKQDAQAVNRVIPDSLTVYYSNCAMVSTSPVDLSLYFGRFVQLQSGSDDQAPIEMYDKQIILTYEQARNLAVALTQTLQMVDDSRTANTAAMGAARRSHTAESYTTKPARSEFDRPALLTKEDLDLELEIPADDRSDHARSSSVPVEPTMRV
jgi:hypothetical protein